MHRLLHSARREWRALLAHPWDLAMVSWVPLLGLALMWWIFCAGLPRALPLGVIDEDHSSQSRQLLRMLDATPGLQLRAAYANGAEAERALRAMEVYGVLRIPPDFARTLRQGRGSASTTLLVNAQLGTHASLLQRDVRAAVATFSAGVEMRARMLRGEPAQAAPARTEPIHVQPLALFNTAGNYERFLGTALLPALLHILAMTAGAASVGRELRDRSLGDWLGPAPRNWQAGAALAGKLGVPWAMLTMAGALALVGATAGRGWQVPGSLAWVLLALALLVAVSLAMGGLLAAWSGSMRTALSGAGLLSAPAFAFGGVGFPLSAMPAGARAWAESMPYTHYIRLQVEQLQMGAPLAASAGTLAGLLLATLALLGASAPALARLARRPERWGAR